MWERDRRKDRHPRLNGNADPGRHCGHDTDLPVAGGYCAMTLAWVLGIVVARGSTQAWGWMGLAVSLTVAMCGVVRGRRLPAPWIGILALSCLVFWSASWTTLRREHRAAGHVLAYVGPVPTLARFSGVVDSEPLLRAAHGGAFSEMSWAPPETRWILRLKTIHRNAVEQACRGRLVVRLTQADPRIEEGDHVQVTGWLSAIGGPQNPGEFDVRRWAESRGIDARLTLVHRDNWQPLTRPATARFGLLRRMCRKAASESLQLGLPTESLRGRAAAALLDAVVLGDRRADLLPWSETFRDAGLMHLLSISGAHLAILLGLTWVVGRLLIAHPARAGMLVLLVLGLCLLVVPWRVPIVRAAIMAGVVTAGVVTGRVSRGLEVVALAALIILWWEPSDLYAPGFQLSFLCVMGLILWTPYVSSWLYRPPLLATLPEPLPAMVRRRAAVYVAANVVASTLALPLVGYHFQLITPYAAIFSMLTIPLLTLILAMAYLKLLVGLVVPSVGAGLAEPLVFLADVMQRGVDQAAGLPGATIALTHAPSLAWTVAALVSAAWVLRYGLASKWRCGAVAIGVCVLWLVAGQWLATAGTRALPDPLPPLRFHALAVGDGTCYLVRVAEPGADSGEHVLMYDCGSLAYLDVGRRTVVPVLASLGVSRIDTLVLSHADLDHFCGVLDVMDHVPVGRVLTTRQLVEAAKEDDLGKSTATGHLLRELTRRRMTVTTVARDWRGTAGAAALRVLWPPRDYAGAATNDTSLVLQVDVPTAEGRRRLMFNGDIQEEAIQRLLAENSDLAADVADLPHHGSFVAASPAWLKRVSPGAVVQSCGRARRQRDAWGALLSAADLPRYDTATYGMVQWVVHGDGTTQWRTFHPADCSNRRPGGFSKP